MLGANLALPCAGVLGHRAFTPQAIFSGGLSGAWWDTSDMSTLFKDTAGTQPVTAHGDPVARVNDKSGNGNHLLQATAANQPVFQNVSGRKYIQAADTGLDWDVMFAGPFSPAFGNNWTRITACADIKGGGATVNGNMFSDGSTGSTETAIEELSTTLALVSNGVVGPSVNFTAGTDMVLTEQWKNPGPCAFDVDNNTGNINPNVAATAIKGMWLGMSFDGSKHARYKFYGGGIFNRLLSAGERQQMITWCGALQGRVL